MNGKTVGCMILTLGAVVLSAQAADYYLKKGVTDWSVAASYTTDAAGTQTATSVPSGSDTIILPADTAYDLDATSASFGVFANCRVVRPQVGSVVRVTVTGEATMNSAFSGDNMCGELVKLGDGVLTLASADRLGDASFMRDYQAGFTVSAGALKLPQSVAKNYAVFGKVTVADGATLFTCCAAADSSAGAWTKLWSLFGAGLVTNAPPVGCPRTSHNLAVYATGKDASCFDGKIAAPVQFYNDEGGAITLTNPQSNFGTLYLAGGTGTYPASDKGTVSAPSLAYPGPLGAWGIQFRENGGTLHYTGAGEATWRSYDFYQGTTDANEAYFDAGATGGITFLGSWRYFVGNSVRPVVLTGSNTTACVFKNAFCQYSGSAKVSPPVSAFYLIKRGTGTWRFADANSTDRAAIGGLAVEDGVVEFESIAERGKVCSLGPASLLTACDPTAIQNGDYVPYAFTLGGTNAGCGLLSYVGLTNAVCTTRPAVLAGKGGFRNNSDKVFCFAGVSGRDEDTETTLVLDGTNAAENRLADVTNGLGTVSVVKEGAGTWKLTGEQSFKGDLKVKAGTLLVEGKDEKYTWFRWTVKETGSSTESAVRVRQFALLDKDGYQQNVGLAYTPVEAYRDWWNANLLNNDYDYLSVATGQVAVGQRMKTKTASGYGPDRLFAGNVSGNPMTLKLVDPTSGTEKPIARNDASSWLTLVMRLPDSANEVVAHDVMGADKSLTANWPKRAMVEASTDGVKWDVVYAEQDYVLHANATAYNNYWYNSGNWPNHPNRIGSGYAHTAGHVTRSPLENVRSVSVSAGATLKSDGSLVIKGLAADAATMGTIDGFTFAETGKLTVESAETGKPISFQGTYRNVTGLGNLANWSVSVNGRDRKGYSVAVDEATGRITVYPNGMAIIIR